MLEPAAGCGCLWPDVELSSEPEQDHLLCCELCLQSPVTWLVPPIVTTLSLTSDPPSRDSAGKICLRSCEVDLYIKRKNPSKVECKIIKRVAAKCSSCRLHRRRQDRWWGWEGWRLH